MTEPEPRSAAIAIGDLEKVLGSESGRRVLGAIVFDVSAVFGPTFAVGGSPDAALYLEGRRSVGRELANVLAARFPDQWIQIQRERTSP